MNGLKIATDFRRLPLEAVTQTFAILAKRGAGKSYTASVMVEEMLEPSRAGFDEVGDAAPAPRDAFEVQRTWLNSLPPTPARMLEYLINIHPNVITREALGEAIDRSTTSSTFANGLSTLRTNGLLEDVGRDVRASETLFL